jgi:hypothetical protein
MKVMLNYRRPPHVTMTTIINFQNFFLYIFLRTLSSSSIKSAKSSKVGDLEFGDVDDLDNELADLQLGCNNLTTYLFLYKTIS